MAESNTLYTRFQQKHDTTSNWNLVASTFVPKVGEIIVYDDFVAATETTPAIANIKIGDGVSTLSQLQFLPTGEIYTAGTGISIVNKQINLDLSDIIIYGGSASSNL